MPCLPVKPWQITRVFLSTKTLAVEDMERAPSAAADEANTRWSMPADGWVGERGRGRAGRRERRGNNQCVSARVGKTEWRTCSEEKRGANHATVLFTHFAVECGIRVSTQKTKGVCEKPQTQKICASPHIPPRRRNTRCSVDSFWML